MALHPPPGPPSEQGKLRTLLGAHLPEIVYGANDGVITTLAVVAGVSGAQLPNQIIVILGLANLVADGFSMGASALLSERSKPNPPRFGKAGRKGGITTMGFVLAGCIPLAAYLVPGLGDNRFWLATILAMITLFLIGAARSFFTTRPFFQAGAEMLLVGSVAALFAYGIGLLGAQSVAEARAL
ncbi:VIT1/CCC1 transporter family protein [Pelagibacterium xiamenense]|uniref:VIT1/CCC1 transporter family protein n=1 Tax=Pelagibacterium xiamenense TaxID=2901140 RepID=UPI001E5FAB0B|nr:VIT1/CCC1 transporter family protein [Pelagibacterium xiamenense]MCD7059353.1 VIT1/CCC1 transporter family protein [Pelagibacterium xiamenense]